MFGFSYTTLLLLKIPITDVLSQTMVLNSFHETAIFFQSVYLGHVHVRSDKGVKPLGKMSRLCRDIRVEFFSVFYYILVNILLKF